MANRIRLLLMVSWGSGAAETERTEHALLSCPPHRAKCGGYPGGNVEYAPAEMQRNGVE
jgi:hypothetical protein